MPSRGLKNPRKEGPDGHAFPGLPRPLAGFQGPRPGVCSWSWFSWPVGPQERWSVSALGCGRRLLGCRFWNRGRGGNIWRSKGSCRLRWVCLMLHCAFVMYGVFQGEIGDWEIAYLCVFMKVVERFPVATLPRFVCVILLCRKRSEVIVFWIAYSLSVFNHTQTVFGNVICYCYNLLHFMTLLFFVKWKKEIRF